MIPQALDPGSVLDALLDAVIVTTEAGDVIAANAAAMRSGTIDADHAFVFVAGGERLVARTARDTTPEAALRARRDLAEERYRTMFEKMPIGFCEGDFSGVGALLLGMFGSGVTDVREKVREEPAFLDALLQAGVMVDMNREGRRIYGAADVSAIRGQPVGMIVADRDAYLGAIHTSTMEGDTFYTTQMRNRRIDGSPVDVLHSVYLPKETRTDFTTFICEMELTDLNRSRHEAVKSQERYRNVFDAMPVAFFALDWRAVRMRLETLAQSGVADLEEEAERQPGLVAELLSLGRVVDANETAITVFGGRDRDHLLGDLGRYWPMASRRVFLAAVNNGYKGGTRYEAETRLLTMDGREIDVIFTEVVPQDSAETGNVVIGIVDISDRVAARAAVERLQTELTHAARVSMLGELTASIAHEVNQPLAAIATNGQASLRWLAREEPEVEEVRELTDRMVADAYRAADIISRIRGMAAKRGPERSNASLNAILEEAVLFLRHELQASGVILSLDLMADLPTIEADRTQLQQVIVNLAMNAMQAMATTPAPECRLAITTRRAGGGLLEVEIVDSGPGIPSDHLGRLFESFFTTKEGGLGMGLPICRSIVEAHGGTISARNNDHAPGATFIFSLETGLC